MLASTRPLKHKQRFDATSFLHELVASKKQECGHCITHAASFIVEHNLSYMQLSNVSNVG